MQEMHIQWSLAITVEQDHGENCPLGAVGPFGATAPKIFFNPELKTTSSQSTPWKLRTVNIPV